MLPLLFYGIGIASNAYSTTLSIPYNTKYRKRIRQKLDNKLTEYYNNIVIKMQIVADFGFGLLNNLF